MIASQQTFPGKKKTPQVSTQARGFPVKSISLAVSFYHALARPRIRLVPPPPAFQPQGNPQAAAAGMPTICCTKPGLPVTRKPAKAAAAGMRTIRSTEPGPSRDNLVGHVYFVKDSEREMTRPAPIGSDRSLGAGRRSSVLFFTSF